MALVFDGPNKIISLTLGTTTLGVRELWTAYVDWFTTSDNSKYQLALSQVGGNPIDVISGTSIPIYIYLENGWRLRPQEANHTLIVNDGILLVQGGGDPFIDTIGNFRVRVNYQQPVQAITVSTGGGSGGLTPEETQKLNEIHRLLGLDVANPVIITEDSQVAGSIILELSGDGITNKTIQRL
jgi:hypothetical protein